MIPIMTYHHWYANLLDDFATEATHRLSYFSSLTRSENCNCLRLFYTLQTILTLSYTCTLTNSNFIHTGTMTAKVIQYSTTVYHTDTVLILP